MLNFDPSDGDWDWDNYSIVLLSQHKDLPCTALAAVHFNVWCAVGNSIHVVHSHLFKMEVLLVQCCVEGLLMIFPVIVIGVYTCSRQTNQQWQ